MTQTEDKFLPYLSYGAFMCIMLALVPWAMHFVSYAINVDIAFLTLSAERLLDGQAMSEAYYDTNPPLSIIVQIPAALIAQSTPIPLYYATALYIFILLGLSLLASNLLLKKMGNISIAQRYIILAIFLVINTIETQYDFGQKDHILAMGLFPLILVQILITSRVEFNKILKWSTLLCGAFLILLKPHYGLIPAAIFIHRMVYQKRFNIFLDQDFICLAGMAIGYVAAIFLFFPDFISIILPDILKFYASDISPQVIETGIILMVQAAIPLIICQIFLKEAPPLISIFAVFSILSFVPFIMQGKGWAYQALPANVFFYCSVGLFISYLTTLTLDAFKISAIKQTAGLLVVFGVLLFSISENYAKDFTPPTHDSYKNTQFAKMINACQGDCSFLILHDMINMSQELSVYTGQPHASRFPTMWFAAFLLNAQRKLDDHETPQFTQEEIDAATQKYTTMIAEDLKKYAPDIIFVGLVPNPAKEGTLFDFHAYLLEKNPKQFQTIWDSYTLAESIDVDRLDYMMRKKPNEGLIRYDIYRKKKQ